MEPSLRTARLQCYKLYMFIENLYVCWRDTEYTHKKFSNLKVVTAPSAPTDCSSAPHSGESEQRLGLKVTLHILR